MKKIIGERIRKLRQGKDLTQDNMAAELDITAGAYAKIERGETDPSATRLIRIAEILEVDVASFFDQKPTVPKPQETASLQTAYALRKDVEKLTQLLKQLTEDVERIKSRVGPVKKTK